MSDHILIDNTAGSAPVIVTLVARNSNILQAHKSSDHILVEDVTDSQAP